MRTLVDPENSLPHLFSPIINLLDHAYFSPDGVENMSGVSLSVYPLIYVLYELALPCARSGFTDSLDRSVRW